MTLDIKIIAAYEISDLDKKKNFNYFNSSLKIFYNVYSIDKKESLDQKKKDNFQLCNKLYNQYLEIISKKLSNYFEIDKDKKLIVTIRKADLAKDAADARPEVFSPGNALDAKITELDFKNRRVKLSVKAAQIDEEKSLIAKFGEGATKSGATLKGIFEKAIGKKGKKDK